MVHEISHLGTGSEGKYRWQSCLSVISSVTSRGLLIIPVIGLVIHPDRDKCSSYTSQLRSTACWCCIAISFSPWILLFKPYCMNISSPGIACVAMMCILLKKGVIISHEADAKFTYQRSWCKLSWFVMSSVHLSYRKFGRIFGKNLDDKVLLVLGGCHHFKRSRLG